MELGTKAKEEDASSSFKSDLATKPETIHEDGTSKTVVKQEFVQEQEAEDDVGDESEHADVREVAHSDSDSDTRDNDISFECIYGSGEFEAQCHILKMGSSTLMLDCGCTPAFDESIGGALHTLRQWALRQSNDAMLGGIDAVLLSHSDLLHIGALPYAVSQLGLAATIYATTPVWRMGQLTLVDSFISYFERHGSCELFGVEDIEKVFGQLFVTRKLKFSEERHIADGLGVSPLSGGCMLGGCIWKVTRETEVVLYMNGQNIRRERHLNESIVASLLTGGSLAGVLKPTLLISDVYSSAALSDASDCGEMQLWRRCEECLLRNGNVLIPTDCAGRCLELLISLHRHFERKRLYAKHKLVLLSRSGEAVLETARSMLEWTSDWCQNQMNARQSNAFELRPVLVCQSKEQFRRKLRGHSFVCLATNEFMEGGFSQSLFFELFSNSLNLVLLTQRCANDSIAGALYKACEQKSKTVTLRIAKRVRLTEAEVAEMRQRRSKRKRHEMEAETPETGGDSEMQPLADGSGAKRRKLEGTEIMAEDSDSSSEEGMDESGSVHSVIRARLSGDFFFDEFRRRRVRISALYPLAQWREYATEATAFGSRIDERHFREASAERNAEAGDLDFAAGFRRGKTQSQRHFLVSEVMSLLPLEMKEAFRKSLSPELSSAFAAGSEHFYRSELEHRQVAVHCEVRFVNLEGRSDFDSMRQLAERIEARQSILIRGNAWAKRKLAAALSANSHIAANGEVLTVECAKAYHSVVMDDALWRRLSAMPIGGYQLSFVSAVVSDVRKLRSDGGLASYRLTALPTANGSLDHRKEDCAKQKWAVLGGVSKIDVVDSLHQAAIPAEICSTKGGNAVVCGENGKVRLSTRRGTGDAHIDAALTSHYFTIRDALQSLFEPTKSAFKLP